MRFVASFVITLLVSSYSLAGKPCPSLASPADGGIGYTDGISIGSVAVYFCDSGYALTGGDRLRNCVDSGPGMPGVWSGTASTCEILSCPTLAFPADGVISFDGRAPYDAPGTTATYSCNPGYVLAGGDAVRTCTEDSVCMVGVWSGDAPGCAPSAGP